MGAIRRLPNGKWEAVVEAGRGNNGRRRQFRRRFGTKRQATAGAARLELEAAAALKASRAGPTVSGHCTEWLTGRLGNLATRTYDTYESVFRNHVGGDPIGAIPLCDLIPGDLRAWMRRLAAKPGRGGCTLSQQTLLHCYRYLGAALNAAVAWELLADNPLRHIETPKVRHDPSKTKAWTVGEARRFMTTLATSAAHDAPMWRAVFGVVLSTGLRRGEIAGLMWRDVNLAAKTLTVVRARSGGRSGTSPTKTASSNRTIYLSEDAIGFLTELKETQETEAAFLGPAWTDTGFVVVYPDGNPPRPDMFARRAQQASAVASVPDIGFHGLRHTFATIGLSGGVSPHQVAAALGHHDMAVTLGTYAHLLPGAQAAAMNAVGNLMFGPSGTKNVT